MGCISILKKLHRFLCIYTVFSVKSQQRIASTDVPASTV
uniref:Uncharacterized protein n=1 Tax=Anguilla anguilla TaxID=7936 RepID=A0A0E9WBQ8_ANGAN